MRRPAWLYTGDKASHFQFQAGNGLSTEISEWPRTTIPSPFPFSIWQIHSASFFYQNTSFYVIKNNY
jgi:hypothetical protein